MDDFSAWLGRKERRVERLEPLQSNALLAALGKEPIGADATALPALHHWLYFWDVRPPSELGTDGHPAKGGFLPPIPLPRRMWAGGRLQFEGELRFGDEVERMSRIAAIETKEGRSGTLVFVAVEHRLTGSNGARLLEEQDLVYREPSATPAPLPAPLAGAPDCDHHETLAPDSVLLFRYSALTMNGHRIHYDRPYATREEGYAGLVVHGPLQATLLADLATRRLGGSLRSFSFRGQSPAFGGLDLHLCCAAQSDGELLLWSQQSEARAMTASAR